MLNLTVNKIKFSFASSPVYDFSEVSQDTI